MAIIQFNEGDYLQTKVIEAGVYPSEVTKIDGPKKSNSGKSNQYFVDITVREGPYKGKSRTIIINTEMNSPSLLGEAQFYPEAYFLELFKATKVDDGVVKAVQLDTDMLLFKPFDAGWGIATVEGRLINIITGFFPAGYGAQQPAF